MSLYSDIPTSILEKMWNDKRLHIRMGKQMEKDLHEAFAMRKELDRRKGETNPSANVVFDKEYLTD